MPTLKSKTSSQKSPKQSANRTDTPPKVAPTPSPAKHAPFTPVVVTTHDTETSLKSNPISATNSDSNQTTITFLSNRRVLLTPTLPGLERVLVRKILTKSKSGFRHNKLPLFTVTEDGLETHLGLLPRVAEYLHEQGIGYGLTNSPGLLQPIRNAVMEKRYLDQWERETFSDLVETIGGGYAIIPDGRSFDNVVAALVTTYKALRILIVVPTNQRLKEIRMILNRRLKKLNITFRTVRGKVDMPQYALATHRLLYQIPSDVTDILIVEQADAVSGPEFEKAVRKFSKVKYGLCREPGNKREDKSLLMESVFGKRVN